MSTLFGEVVYPSSRAFWNDDDEDDNQNIENLSKLFTIEWSGEIPKEIKTLLVIETQLIIDFTSDYLSNNAKEVGQIKSASSNNPSRLFKAADGLFICTINPDVDLSQAGEFVDAMSDILKKSKNIIAVTSNHKSQLKSAEGTNVSAFLSSLSTKKVSDDQKKFMPMLKQPNIVSGVAAGVVAFAEIMDQSASLNVLYVDGYELDSESAAPLTKLFSKVTEHQLPEFTCGKTFIFNKGNLYMYLILLLLTSSSYKHGNLIEFIFTAIVHWQLHNNDKLNVKL